MSCTFNLNLMHCGCFTMMMMNKMQIMIMMMKTLLMSIVMMMIMIKVMKMAMTMMVNKGYSQLKWQYMKAMPFQEIESHGNHWRATSILPLKALPLCYLDIHEHKHINTHTQEVHTHLYTQWQINESREHTHTHHWYINDTSLTHRKRPLHGATTLAVRGITLLTSRKLTSLPQREAVSTWIHPFCNFRAWDYGAECSRSSVR